MNTGCFWRNVQRQVTFAMVITAMLWVVPALCGTTGSIDGVVKDTSGTPIAGARITLINSGMGIKQNVTTGKNGAYRFPLVVPGEYELRAEAKNFKPQSKAGLVVHVNGALRVDLALDVEDTPAH